MFLWDVPTYIYIGFLKLYFWVVVVKRVIIYYCSHIAIIVADGKKLKRNQKEKKLWKNFEQNREYYNKN